ncbi:MAG: RluA family pseudouridine synthase [Acidobacteriota bacterium]
MFERHFIEVDVRYNKMRLDDFLFEKIPTLSRMYLRELIKTERCEVNGANENAGRKLKPRDFIEIELDPTRGTAMRPENIPIEIVYEDASIIVVNKPTGMLAHPTHRDKNGTLLNALSFHLNQAATDSAAVRPGLVHRLDKQTSGLMLIAKTVKAHRVLADHFKRKLVEKRYVALVEGVVEKDQGSIDGPIGRYAELKLWNIKKDGKAANTRFWVRKRFADTTLIEFEPVTGRTNQLRIHSASIGHPIVGDIARGGREFARLCLAAHRLAFHHPADGRPMGFELDHPEKYFRSDLCEI